MIAHRLSTIRRADIIFVVQDGRIAESGNHDTLLSLGGLYAQFFKLQAQQESKEQLARSA